jgi:hypothetical protein
MIEIKATNYQISFLQILLDMYLFLNFAETIYSDVFFLMTRSWVHVENMYISRRVTFQIQ